MFLYSFAITIPNLETCWIPRKSNLYSIHLILIDRKSQIIDLIDQIRS